MAHNKTKKQNEFIKAYQRHAGNVSAACKSVNIPRRTYYNWIKDKNFKNQITEADEDTIDYVVSKLLQAVGDGNITAIIFYLKTKGKERGYVETNEIKMETIRPIIEITPDLKEDHDKMKDM